MKILSTISLLLIINISTLKLAQAEETNPVINLKEYDVEIIIFEDAHARYLSSQSWGQTAPDIDEDKIAENTVEVTEINTSNFESIKPSILKEKYKRVSASSEYNILFYGAWRQAGLAKDEAFEININDLKNNHGSKSTNTLSGKFKLILTRYLHIYSELEYLRKPISTTDEQLELTEISNESYPLKSHRRMRSKELHYIDHPLVGILIQINPVEKKEEEKL